MDPILLSYLHTWYSNSIAEKQRNHIAVDFTFDEFLALWQPNQINVLLREHRKGNLYFYQRHANPTAYVFTWKSYRDCSFGAFNKHTACITTRQMSLLNNLPKPGDKLRPSHCAALSKSRKGKPKSEEAKKATSESLKGKPKAAWTEERKAARRAQIAARRAAQ